MFKKDSRFSQLSDSKKTKFQEINWSKPPNQKLFKTVIIFRIGIAIAALLSLLLSSGCVSSLAWTQENQEILQQAVTENSLIKSPEEIAQVRTSSLSKEKNLILVDYRNDKLCGFQGCLYNLYLNGKNIWGIYLNPNLPPEVDLFSPNFEISNELPCLDIKQYKSKTLAKISYCFDGETYTVQNLPL